MTDASSLAAALNGAGLRIFRAAAGEDNLAVSPLSIGMAFGLADAGASGPADDALGRLFAYPMEGDALSRAFHALGRTVASDGADAADGDEDSPREGEDLPVVRVAAGLWCDQEFVPEPSYVDVARSQFGADVTRAPLRSDPAGSRDAIDAWVRERTAGLIPRVMPEDLPGPDTCTVLVTTLYLKARWRAPFSASTTSPADFHLLDGTRVQAELMGGALSTRFVRSERLDAVVLPYVGDLEMVVLVPHAGEFGAVREGLDGDALAALDRSWSNGRVWVSMPRFETASMVALRDIIETGLGIWDLFCTPGFDGIGPDLVMDAAVHATKVIVDEDGTEAAAATVIGIMMTSLPLYDAEITADRPFLYVIRETTTGAILFLGQYTGPAGR